MREAIKKYIESELKLSLKENYQIFPSRVRGVDFLGYRFFGNYILLRKRVLKNMKKALIKLRNKEVLSYHDNCTINSYKGWLNFCNSYRLKEKYFIPLKDKKYINKDGKLRRVNIW